MTCCLQHESPGQLVESYGQLWFLVTWTWAHSLRQSSLLNSAKYSKSILFTGVWHFHSLTFVLFVWALNKKFSLFSFLLKTSVRYIFFIFFISNVSHLLKCWSKYLCNMRTVCSSFTCYSTWLISVLFIVLSCIPLNNFMNICCFLC